MLQAILFDMDGTLLDSEPLHLQAIRLLLNEFGVKDEEEPGHLVIGSDYESIWDHNIKRYELPCSVKEAMQMQNVYTRRCFEKAKLIESPGLTEFLKDIRTYGVRTAVASSSPQNIIELILDKLDIKKYMDVLCGIEMVRKAKPSPELFLLAASRLKVKPSDCLVIEDSLPGIKAAKAAGMRCVAVKTEGVTDAMLKQADHIIQTFRKIDYRKAVLLYERKSEAKHKAEKMDNDLKSNAPI